MAGQQSAEVIIALYGTLADAEAALQALQASGIDYAHIRLQAHAGAAYAVALPLGDTRPEQVWTLTLPAEVVSAQAEELLQQHNALDLGRAPAPAAGRDEVDQGAIAWRHYRFDAAGSDQIGEAAGTTGTTGVISSGAFADTDRAVDEETS